MIRVAILTTDSREHFKDYANPRPYFGTAPEALLEGFQTMPNEVEIHVVSCLQSASVSSPEKLARNIFYHGLHVPNIGWLKTGYFGCTRAVRRKLRQIQPDIVHGQGTERDCAIAAVLSGYPNVLTIHGNMRLVADFLKAKPLSYYWLAAKLERYCLRKTAGVIAISSYTQSNVSRVTRRNWLIPNAVHPSFFASQRQPTKPPRILCVANIGARKNQIGLIHSLDLLVKETQLKLVFAGGGSNADPYFQKFKSIIDKREWCEYLGSLDRLALQNEMAVASVGVLPSFEDNCPMVVLEAAASGLPFVASRVGGVPDLIEHSVTGLLFDPSSSNEIRATIDRMLQDKHLATTVAEKALTACKLRFAPESVAQRHLGVYTEVLTTSARRKLLPTK